jgi:hypothetical protein
LRHPLAQKASLCEDKRLLSLPNSAKRPNSKVWPTKRMPENADCSVNCLTSFKHADTALSRTDRTSSV